MLRIDLLLLCLSSLFVATCALPHPEIIHTDGDGGIIGNGTVDMPIRLNGQYVTAAEFGAIATRVKSLENALKRPFLRLVGADIIPGEREATANTCFDLFSQMAFTNNHPDITLELTFFVQDIRGGTGWGWVTVAIDGMNRDAPGSGWVAGGGLYSLYSGNYRTSLPPGPHNISAKLCVRNDPITLRLRGTGSWRLLEQ